MLLLDMGGMTFQVPVQSGQGKAGRQGKERLEARQEAGRR